MRKLVAIAALALAACNEGGGSNQSNAVEEEAAPVDVVAMLKANDTEVCGVQEVQDLAMNVLDGDYSNYLLRGNERIMFDVVNASAIDKDLHQITCNARVHPIFYDFYSHKMATGDFPFEYKVRPAVGGQYVVETLKNGLIATGHIRREANAMRDRERQEADAAVEANTYDDREVLNVDDPDEEVEGQAEDATINAM